MPNIMSFPTTLAALLGLGLMAVPAQAFNIQLPPPPQPSHTFVSGAIGNDANPCWSPLAPCRTLQNAHNKTAPDGEITVLDPGDYGAVTITKGISIVADGVGEAGMSISGGAAGVLVKAGAADTVNLRGLTIKGLDSSGSNGIVFVSGKSLNVENCVIRNLSDTSAGGTGNGIFVLPSATAPAQIAVSNTVISDNTRGMIILPSGFAQVAAALNRVEFHGNSVGLLVSLSSTTVSAKVALIDSVVAGSSDTGIVISSPVGALGNNVAVVRSTIANNGTGFLVGGDSSTAFWITQSSVTGNKTNWNWTSNGGFVWGFRNNNMAFGDDFVVTNDTQIPPSGLIAKQ